MNIAFAPAHITGFFKIYEDGSTGAGINPNKGALTKVEVLESDSGIKIFINDQQTDAEVSRYVLDEFYQICPDLKKKLVIINHQLNYPVGYGMGMSGAGAFSLALALNKASSLSLTLDDCMYIAMRSEIKAGTGLGDVIAQKYYGLMIGLPPYPSRTVEIINCDKKFIGCGFFAPLSTEKIIRDLKWKEQINAVGTECMQELEKDKTYKKFIELCRYFTLSTGLASSEVKSVMEKLPESSMAMLGQSVFILAETEQEAMDLLTPHCKRIEIAEISKRGAHVIE